MDFRVTLRAQIDAAAARAAKLARTQALVDAARELIKAGDEAGARIVLNMMENPA